ncbi:uncharacterized protein LOC131598912 [Vicia villosa]|uniref:uncharacterized protein LOC131598912 n=1 Tax=Vicia villosa TaxID=3911 RepID=UPI00273A7CC8|nr:uncharacterized protein LOC131598912 [Vicia villosa]
MEGVIIVEIVQKTILHVLRDCDIIKPLWLSIVKRNDRGQGQEEGKYGLEQVLGDDFQCSVEMEESGEPCRGFVRPGKQEEAVRQFLDVMPVDDNIIHPKERDLQISIQVSGKAPKDSWVCLNVDGACRNRIISCGGAIRGSEGEWLSGFSKFIDHGDALMAELRGLLEGLNLARKLKFFKVEIRVDSIEVVEIIGRKQTTSVGRSIVQEIWSLLDLDWELVLFHSYQEENRQAEALAKHSFPLADMCIIFLQLPRFVYSYIWMQM